MPLLLADGGRAGVHELSTCQPSLAADDPDGRAVLDRDDQLAGVGVELEPQGESRPRLPGLGDDLAGGSRSRGLPDGETVAVSFASGSGALATKTVAPIFSSSPVRRTRGLVDALTVDERAVSRVLVLDLEDAVAPRVIRAWRREMLWSGASAPSSVVEPAEHELVLHERGRARRPRPIADNEAECAAWRRDALRRAGCRPAGPQARSHPGGGRGRFR